MVIVSKWLMGWQIDVQYPPYVLPGTSIMAPSVWFGTSTSSTKTHSDCCDNFAAMISGKKVEHLELRCCYLS